NCTLLVIVCVLSALSLLPISLSAKWWLINLAILCQYGDIDFCSLQAGGFVPLAREPGAFDHHQTRVPVIGWRKQFTTLIDYESVAGSFSLPLSPPLSALI